MKWQSLLVFSITGIFVIFSLITPFLPGQFSTSAFGEGALGLALALRKLPVTASFLHTAAHPDDEANPLLVMLNRGRGMRTGLLTLTRGGGGQNEIGDELFEALGIVRTEELMSMHAYDGAQQYFGRAADFGYSFSVEETFERWGKDEILDDTVRVIRQFRPDVIVTLPTQGTGGGQHHQAAALLTVEAFRAAADPHRFPEHLQQGLHPWQAKRLYERYRWAGGGSSDRPDERHVVHLETGIIDPLLGRSYLQIGLQARSYHRCQGMGQFIPVPGKRTSQWKLVDSVAEVHSHNAGFFDGINTGLFALEDYAQGKATFLHSDLVSIQQLIDEAIAAFRMDNPQQTTPFLASGLKAVQELRRRLQTSDLDSQAKYELDFRLEHKEKDFTEALNASHQLSLDALASDGTVTPGQEFDITITIASADPGSVSVESLEVLAPQPWAIRTPATGVAPFPAEGILTQKFHITVPKGAELTRPYWQHHPQADRYEILKKEDHGKPWSPPALSVRLHYRINGVVSSLTRPVEARYEGPWVGGEQRHELMVVPAISLSVDPKIGVIPLDQASHGRQVRLNALYNSSGPASGYAKLSLPQGWRSVPEQVDLGFTEEGQSITRRFQIFPPSDVSAGSFQIGASVFLDDKHYQEGYQVIDYHHTQRRLLYQPAIVKVRTVDVKINSEKRIGYVMGVGDQVPQALDQLGLDFEELGPDDLAFAELSLFDVIVLGVRAYLNREDLRTHNRRLLDWVHKGGTLIVQYNKFEFNQASRRPDGNRRMEPSTFAPYPAKIGRGRVTDETSPIKILEPTHPLFTQPNQLNSQDWEEWVQERGLYFLGERDPNYTDLVSLEDPFKYNAGIKLGALVEARYGQGRWIYVGLGLWRQLPAGVPGAYRVLANLLSLSQ